MTWSQKKHQSIETNTEMTHNRMNQQGYVHLAVLNVFHLFKEREEKHAYNEQRHERY